MNDKLVRRQRCPQTLSAGPDHLHIGEDWRQSLQVRHFLIVWLEMIYPIEVYIFFYY